MGTRRAPPVVAPDAARTEPEEVEELDVEF